MGARLRQLHEGLGGVIEDHAPHEAAVKETFVNRDPQSALKLGQARGVALTVPALAGLEVRNTPPMSSRRPSSATATPARSRSP